jgi:hypothetical protein
MVRAWSTGKRPDMQAGNRAPPAPVPEAAGVEVAMPELCIYRLVPIPGPDDANFDLAQYQGEVVVRALSSGDARVVAAEGEARASGKDPGLFTTALRASALLEPHLYAVRLVADGTFPTDGEREVLLADFRPGPTGPEPIAHID